MWLSTPPAGLWAVFAAPLGSALTRKPTALVGQQRCLHPKRGVGGLTSLGTAHQPAHLRGALSCLLPSRRVSSATPRETPSREPGASSLPRPRSVGTLLFPTQCVGFHLNYRPTSANNT